MAGFGCPPRARVAVSSGDAGGVTRMQSFQPATSARRLGRRMQVYLAPKVLILDEMGYLPLDDLGATIFFQLVSARYERGGGFANCRVCRAHGHARSASCHRRRAWQDTAAQLSVGWRL